MSAVTQWFKAHEKPKRKGVYERDIERPYTVYSYWNGRYWSVGDDTVNDAYLNRFSESAFQSSPWRGRATRGAK